MTAAPATFASLRDTIQNSDADICAIDLFCGGGGMSCGMVASGIKIAGGVDVDVDALRTFEANFGAGKAINADLSKPSERDRVVAWAIKKRVNAIFGGPPCQGYSKLNNHSDKQRYLDLNALPLAFVDVVERVRPAFVVMEEVRAFANTPMLGRVRERLEAAGYACATEVLNARHFGVPQNRARLILIAYRSDIVPVAPQHPHPTTSNDAPVTVARALTSPPKPARGDPVSDAELQWIRMHEAGTLREAKPNWHNAAYGVINQNRVVGTITTNVRSAGGGTFTIKRGSHYYKMSVEEAARLQSFPPSFTFVPTKAKSSLYRQIGNSVPPRLAYAIGRKLKAAAQKAQPSLKGL